MVTWNYVLRYWRDALEILILAMGIYYALRFVRGTRGWPVARVEGTQLVAAHRIALDRLGGVGHFSTGIAPHVGRTGQPAAVRHDP